MGINTFPAASSSGVNYSGGSQASRPAAPTTGNTFFNTTDNSLEIYNGTNWVNLVAINESPTWNTPAGSFGNVLGNTALLTGAWNFSATDPEGGNVVYTLQESDKPAWLSVNSSTGALSGTTPTVTSTTTVTFTGIATDSAGNFTKRSFNFVIFVARSVEYLFVGGGGGGAIRVNRGGPGGGAGGMITGNLSTATSLESTLTVGAGGAGRLASENGGAGIRGNNSSLVVTGITTAGFGGGGADSGGLGGPNGSGGGSSDGGIGEAGTAGQGSNGGSGTNSGSGGGGGKTGTGGNGGGSSGGAGGAGGTSSISGSSVTYAGGGGGSHLSGGASGGSGGGGAGTGAGSNAGNGSVNTGGGGGGTGANQPPTSNCGNGGSGIVILKYPNTDPAIASISGGLTYTSSNTGGNYIYKFTAGTGTVTW
jgi:hypothetical protein